MYRKMIEMRFVYRPDGEESEDNVAIYTLAISTGLNEGGRRVFVMKKQKGQSSELLNVLAVQTDIMSVQSFLDGCTLDDKGFNEMLNAIREVIPFIG